MDILVNLVRIVGDLELRNGVVGSGYVRSVFGVLRITVIFWMKMMRKEIYYYD